LDTLLSARVGLALERALVIAVRVGGLLQLLVRARDVEDDVLVGDEPVRREEVLERSLVVGGLVLSRREAKLEIGLVGHVVGGGGAREGRHERESDEREAELSGGGSHRPYLTQKRDFSRKKGRAVNGSGGCRAASGWARPWPSPRASGEAPT
jgi:hypothetical protein